MTTTKASDADRNADVAAAAALLDLVRSFARRILPPPLDGFSAAIPPRPPARSLPPRPLPVLRWMERLAVATTAETVETVAALQSAAARLSWGQSYRAEDISATFLERYGWCELLGSRGHFRCDDLALGFLLLGPDRLYPLHSHEAEEVYVALSGTAFWRKGGEGPQRALPPGSVIHHPSWTPHAMRTGDEPLLALYFWRGGDLAQKSRLS